MIVYERLNLFQIYKDGVYKVVVENYCSYEIIIFGIICFRFFVIFDFGCEYKNMDLLLKESIEDIL